MGQGPDAEDANLMFNFGQAELRRLIFKPIHLGKGYRLAGEGGGPCSQEDPSRAGPKRSPKPTEKGGGEVTGKT